MDRRKLTDAAEHSGGVIATARGQGYIEQLEKPYPSRQEIVGAGNRITGVTRKAVEDERVAEGPVVAGKRSNVRGAKRPCCLQ
jgi:hypothetical protein